MAQVVITQILTPENEPSVERIEYYFGELGVGSLLVVPPDNGEYINVQKYRFIVATIQETAKRYNRPPVLVGIDSVHGANYIKDSVMMPQQINLASTWNTSCAEVAGYLAGRDTRAAGITWLFSPILGLGIQPSWSRFYETFGEDPLLVGTMGKAMIRGIHQIDKSFPSRSAACAKHFIGYSAPVNGHDRSPSWIPVRHLYQYFVKPWRYVLDNEDGESVLTVMESYSEYDGVPNVANKNSLRYLLRGYLKFNGVLVTDYEEINNLVGWHHVAFDEVEAVKLSLAEGSIDLSMVPFNIESWRDNVLKSMSINPLFENENGGKQKYSQERNEYAPYPVYPQRIEENRLNESVERILRLKDRLQMFEEEILIESEQIDHEEKFSKDREIGLQLARESIILTKNQNVLPLLNQRGGKNLKVHVTGPTANSLRYQSGGWSIKWQGADSDEMFTYGITVLDAAKRVDSWDVSYSCGTDILGKTCSKTDSYNDVWAASDIVIICVGEENYTEKPGDISNLSLPEGQIQLVKDVRNSVEGVVILVYFGGRPRLLGDIVSNSDAIFISFLPGPDAGQAIVDLIIGDVYSPSAKLPITYPKYADFGGVPYWSAVSNKCTGSITDSSPLPHYQYKACEVEWPFGHGLSYTEFNYSQFSTSSSELTFEIDSVGTSTRVKGSLAFTLNVKNVGERAGSDVIPFFIFEENRYVTPEFKRLWHYEKVLLSPGEDRDLIINLDISDMRYIGPHNERHSILQAGMKFRVGVGSDSNCRMGKGLCTGIILLRMSRSDNEYIGSCEAACNIWNDSDCDSIQFFGSKSCYETCLAASSDGMGVEWGWSYVDCIESILRDKVDVCARMTTFCRDIFHSDLPGSGNLNIFTITVAFISGLLGLIFVYLPFRRQINSRSSDFEDIEFTRVIT